MTPADMDANFVLLSRLPTSGRHTLQRTWEQTATHAVNLFGDGADAAVFLQRLYVNGALHEDLEQPNLGLMIIMEDPQSRPGIVPTLVGIPLEFLNAAGLERILEPEAAAEPLAAPHAAAA